MYEIRLTCLISEMTSFLKSYIVCNFLTNIKLKHLLPQLKIKLIMDTRQRQKQLSSSWNISYI